MVKTTGLRAQRHALPRFYTVEIISALDGMMGLASQSVESEDTVSIRQLIEMTEKQEPVISQFKPKALATDTNIDTGAKKALLGMVFYLRAHSLDYQQAGTCVGIG